MSIWDRISLKSGENRIDFNTVQDSSVSHYTSTVVRDGKWIMLNKEKDTLSEEFISSGHTGREEVHSQE